MLHFVHIVYKALASDKAYCALGNEWEGPTDLDDACQKTYIVGLENISNSAFVSEVWFPLVHTSPQGICF